MESFDSVSNEPPSFRQMAENKIIAGQPQNKLPAGTSIIHELEVALLQIELQKQALEAAMEKEHQLQAKYTALYNLESANYFTLNQSGRIIELNNNAALLIGNEKEAALNKEFTSFISVFFQEVFLHFLNNIFKTNHTCCCEVEIYNQQGQNLQVQIDGIAAEGMSNCVLVVVDINKQKNATAVTAQSDEKYKMLIEQAYDGVLIYNQEGVLLQWNEKTQHFLGYTYNEFKDLRLSDLFFKEELILRPISFKKLREGHSVLDYRRLKRKNGTGIEMEINSKMLQDGTVIVFGKDVTERKRAEEEKNRLLNILQKSLDEIFMFSAESWLFEYANDGALQNTGYNTEELYRLSSLDLIPGINKEIFSGIIAPLLKRQKETIVFESKHQRKNGTHYPVEVHLQLITYGNKQVFVVNARDITERVKAAQELKRAYEILEETNKVARVGGYELDVKKGTSTWSVITREIHEVSADFEVTLDTAIHFYEGVYKDMALSFVKNAIEKGLPFDAELQLTTAKGNKKWVRATGSTEFEGGACVRLFGTLQDIHNRKMSEEILSAKEKYFRALIEHSASAIVLFDEKGNFIYQSPVVEKIMGYKIDDAEDKNLFDFIHPDDVENFISQLTELINYPQTIQEGIYRFRHADGHYIWLEGSVTNRLHDSNVRALIANYHDVSERKTAAEQIKAERSLLRTLIDNLPDPIYVKDPMGRKVLANKEDLVYMDVQADAEIIGKTDLELFPNHTGEYGHYTDMSVMENGAAIYNKEEYFIDKNGSSRWMITSKVPLRNPDGTITGLLGIGRDITNNKVSEDALIKSNERYEYATQATFDAVWDWDMGTDELFWGKNYETIFGHCAADSNTNFNTWIKNVHPDDLNRVMQSIKDAKLATQNIWAEEYRFKKSNGDYAFVLDKGIVIRDKNGKAIRMIGAMQDITPRKLQDEKLALLESVVTNTIDAIVITEAEPFDMPGPKILYVNDAFTTITGYTQEEVIGKTPRILQGPKTDRKELDRLKEKIKKWKTCEIEIINYKKNGEEFWVNFVLVPIANGEGIFTHWVSIQRDVTQRKMEEKKLQALNDELAKQANALMVSNSELERFAYVASHDLQEPLRMVGSFLKLLEAKYKPQLDDTAKQYIHFAVDGAERMKQLILDLLEYSRVSTNKDNTVNTDMNEVFNEVVSIFSMTISDLNASVETIQLPILSNTRRTLMLQLMQNLVGNALKYHNNQMPVIKIAAVEENEYWLFSVADNGIGINPVFAEKIFVIFQRLHNKDHFPGTGIGLSICKKIVEMHGGKMWVESEPGEGAVFYFTIKK